MPNTLNHNYYLGLDFGTSGVRACIIDQSEAIQWEQRISYTTPEMQIPQDWRSALYALLSLIPLPLAEQLAGLAINGTSATVLLCDANLMPISSGLLYNDTRAHVEADYLKSIAPSPNSSCHASSGLAKFCWLTKQNYGQPPAYFFHQADWLTSLVSQFPGISDYHNALKTGYDLENLCWPEWISQLPHSHLLPQVGQPGQVISMVRPDVAAHFNISPHCLVHAGTTDSTAAFIASRVNQIGIGVSSLGSTLVLKQLSPHRIEAPEFGIYSHRFGDLWLVGGASNSGAAVLRHYFDDAEISRLSQQIQPATPSPLDYYPLTRPGERFPINDPQLAPRLSPRPANDAEFLHGILQGIARIEQQGYQKLQALGAPPLQQIISCGGGSRSEVWRQIRQQIIGLPVQTAHYPEAAFGSALLAKQKGCLPQK